MSTVDAYAADAFESTTSGLGPPEYHLRRVDGEWSWHPGDQHALRAGDARRMPVHDLLANHLLGRMAAARHALAPAERLDEDLRWIMHPVAWRLLISWPGCLDPGKGIEFGREAVFGIAVVLDHRSGRRASEVTLGFNVPA